jgi:hypothetical protein
MLSGRQVLNWGRARNEDAPMQLQLPDVTTGVYLLQAWPSNGPVHHFKIIIR